MMQPIASDDVAAVVADVALAEPLNGTIELAGPEPIRQDDLVRRFLNATGDLSHNAEPVAAAAGGGR
jgi:uncharacterized protein YbjT (DUF2867 family)